MAVCKFMLLFVVVWFGDISAVKVREAKERSVKLEPRESNEYDLKTIFNYLQSQDSKEKKERTSIYDMNDEQRRETKIKERENEEMPHIKVKERENEEMPHIKVKERENEDHRIKERETGERRNMQREPRERRPKDETENPDTTLTPENHRRGHRAFAKIAPTVGIFATPKITSIKKWKNKNKENKLPRLSGEDEDVSRSYPDEEKKTSKSKKHKNNKKRTSRTVERRKEHRDKFADKRSYSSLNNDLVISKEINMTKSFKSDQPVDIIVHIKMKN